MAVRPWAGYADGRTGLSPVRTTGGCSAVNASTDWEHQQGDKGGRNLMNRRLVVAAGGTAVGAALLLSGCNGDGSGSNANMKLSANEALLKSSQKTAQSDTFKADLT